MAFSAGSAIIRVRIYPTDPLTNQEPQSPPIDVSEIHEVRWNGGFWGFNIVKESVGQL